MPGPRGEGAEYFFAVIVPYAAAGLFLCGVIYRIARWGRSPVPFRIPATGGQQKSLALDQDRGR